VVPSRHSGTGDTSRPEGPKGRAVIPQAEARIRRGHQEAAMIWARGTDALTSKQMLP
jgi:hypothetical protein